MNVNVLLFDGFETLDAFGPVEMLSRMGKNTITCCSLTGGNVRSSHGFQVLTVPVSQTDPASVLLIPGGMATRKLVRDEEFLSALKEIASRAEYVLTVCTGSALLARTGLMDGRRATSNKKAFQWVRSTADRVLWQSRARWVADGKFYTSSGVTAGIDMALGFLRDVYGEEVSRTLARNTEYIWNDDSARDPFAAEEE